MNRTLSASAVLALGLMLAACGGGGSSSGGGGGGGGGTPITLSGLVQYQRVPHFPATHPTTPDALDYSSIATLPVRGATVEARAGSSSKTCASGTLLGSAKTDASGNYTLTSTSNTAQKVCVRAELLLADAGAAPSWNVQVRDNTQSDALYILQSASFTPAAATVQNLTAATGWGGASYTGTRASAPFAILDSIYTAMQKVLTADPNADFPALDVFWSVNNTDASGNINSGRIGTTYYASNEIYVLGDADNDTDEFDDHVIVHELGHYLQDRFSRDDSLGGNHSNGDLLDLRVAYSEGWGNAWSGIATDDPVYQDSSGAAQGQGFDFNVETEVDPSSVGWYSETSVETVLYDLYDATNEGGGSADSLALGLAPIWGVFTSAQRTTPAMTSIFSFLDGLRTANPGSLAAIDAIATARNINGTDAYGTGETNDGATPLVSGASAVLPPHIPYTVGSGATAVCVSAANGTENALGDWRLLRFTLAATGSHTISVSAPSGTDADAWLYNAGTLISGSSGFTDGNESFSKNLAPGTYVLEVDACENTDPGHCGGNATNQTPGPRCLQVTVN